MVHPGIVTLPDPLPAMVEDALDPGEQILWIEQPIPDLLGRKARPIFFAGIGSSIFFSWAAYDMLMAGGAYSRLVFFAPFFLICLLLMDAPRRVRSGALRSVYVLTARRAMAFVNTFWGRVDVRCFDLRQMNHLQSEVHPDGSGDLIFARETDRDIEGNAASTYSGFLAIRDVGTVEELVRSLIRSRRA